MEIRSSEKRAVVVGATGLVGQELVRLLDMVPAYSRVRVIARRQKPAGLSDKIDWIQNRLTDHHEYEPLVRGDDIYIALGTTMAKAGSKEAFRRIDYELSFHVAKAGVMHGAGQLMLVTAVGADKDSLFFYNRVKGELEEAVLSLPYWAVHIFRPSMLLGARNESRTLESIGQRISTGLDRLAGKWLGAYRPVSGKAVAQAMVHAAQQLEGGHSFHPSDEIATFDGDPKLPTA